MKKIILLLSGLSLIFNSYAKQYYLPSSGSDIIGEIQYVTAKSGDTLNALAVRHGVGYNEMAKANRKWGNRKIPAGTSIVLPTQHKLPNASRNGIVINLADMRLYYYPPGGNTVYTYPVAVGKSGWSTPKGRTSVIAKHKNPTWTPPASIHREAARKGRKLKKVYPAGPNNPLGTRALRLGLPGYLIHGTNKPWSIGKRVSHGCIRMRRSDIEQLFSLVSVNTPVTIVSEGTSLNYSDSSGAGRAVASSGRSNSEKSTRKNSNSKKQYASNQSTKRQNTKRVQKKPARPSSEPYISNRGLDYNRLQRDIQNGVTNPIPLD